MGEAEVCGVVSVSGESCVAVAGECCDSVGLEAVDCDAVGTEETADGGCVYSAGASSGVCVDSEC